ncbi:outer membrane lipoprotein-sorting protein [Gimesia panareensis]|uniref:outer membrane lipoprotein-sorting protein n=1 Tax=Gimesia panareensis TaxID=2527978 RepID=UPI00118969F4|nr:outer membrane lipoprotein-sorting protein [Gimesia panareensis]QDU47799.1 hypothetical protein Pan110_01090 [Gimesia panareensis]
MQLPCFNVYTLLVLLATAVPATAADQRLSALISKVAAQEQRYRNLEFHRHWSYQLKLPEPLLKQRKDTNLFRELQRDTHYVYQNRFYAIQARISGVQVTGDKTKIEVGIGYDGQQTRFVENGVVSLLQGKELIYQHRKPHVFLLDRLAEEPSLAELLTSPTARGYFLSMKYEAEENVKGLNCHRIRIETWVKGQKRHDYSRLWLAPERNWIPIREEGYALGYSETIPLQISEVTDWHQFADGIWFPHKIRDVIHDEQSAADGKTIIGNQSETTLTEISFSPSYDRKYFQDVPLPAEKPDRRSPKQPAE